MKTENFTQDDCLQDTFFFRVERSIERAERLCNYSSSALTDPKYPCQIALNLTIICSLTSWHSNLESLTPHCRTCTRHGPTAWCHSESHFHDEVRSRGADWGVKLPWLLLCLCTAHLDYSTSLYWWCWLCDWLQRRDYSVCLGNSTLDE